MELYTGLAILASLLLGPALAYFFSTALKETSEAAKKEPPSPPAHSLLFSLLGMGHAPFLSIPDLHRKTLEWAEEHGSVIKVYLRGVTYMITDAKLANQVVSRGEVRLPKFQSLYTIMDDLLSQGHRQMFSTGNEQDDIFRGYRKGMAPAFSTDNLKKNFPAVRTIAERMVERWSESQARGEPVLADEWMSRATLDIIGKVGFHYDFRSLEESEEGLAFIDAMHKNLLEVSALLGDPLRGVRAKLLPFTEEAKAITRQKRHVKELFISLYEHVKSRGEPTPDDQSIGANLMRIKNPTTGKPFPPETVVANLSIMVIAGYDTTAATCVWALYDIARHPEIQKRIKQELAEAGLLQVQGQPQARQLEYADLTALPYFNAVLKESMRLHTVAATGVFKKVAVPSVELGGYSIPKGSAVWLPFYAMHNSTYNFVNPKEFIPERWIEGAANAFTTSKTGKENSSTPVSITANSASSGCPAMKAIGAIIANDAKPHATPHGHAELPAAKATLPFSDGTRGCIGQSLAYLDARTILLAVLSKFWLELDPSVGSHAEVEAAQVMALVLCSGIPIRLRVTHHQ